MGCISRIIGDKYAGIWPVEAFSRVGIHYEQSAKAKSDLYVDLLPLINSRRIELLDHDRCINQLCGLERRTARGGKGMIDHPPGAHDDLANAVAGVTVRLIMHGSYDPFYGDGPRPSKSIVDRTPDWRHQQTINYMLTGGFTRPW